MENESIFRSSFTNMFQPGNNAEEISDTYVYHYTNAKALISIFEDKNLRFSDIRYMNDRSEMAFFVKRLIEFITDNGEQHPFFRDAVNELLAENKYSQILDLSINKIQYKDVYERKMMTRRTFIFCTCDKPDLLNMWNYYASGGTYSGYNIGFSVKNFLKTFDTEQERKLDSFVVYYGHVLYDKKKQYEAIDELARKIEKQFGRDKKINHAAITIQWYIEQQGAFFKDDSFSSEKEYRFLLSIADNRIPYNEEDAQKYFGKYNKKLCEKFYDRNGVIVPYMQVAIPENSVSRITVSPMTEYEIAKNSIKELLKANGILSTTNKEVAVYKSNIPIRF